MRKYLVGVFALLLVLFINVYFRLYPAYFPQLKGKATVTVEREIFAQAESGIEKTFSRFSPVVKDKLIGSEFETLRKQKKGEINAKIEQEYRKLKGKYQDEKNQTYLLELDPYHAARYVENILAHGYPGDSMRGKDQFDALMLAPEGSYLSWSQFPFYAAAYLYTFVSFFHRDLSLFTFLFYYPVFLSCLFIIVLFLLCFFLFGTLGSTIACLSVGLTNIFLSRSCGGWFDTDVYNLLFPLCIVWAYTYALSATSVKKRIVFLTSASFTTGLFAYAWLSWWFVLGIIGFYSIFSIMNIVLSPAGRTIKFRVLKLHLSGIIIYVSVSYVFVLVFCGSGPLSILVQQVREAFSLDKPLGISLWPNVYYTVQELSTKRLAQLGDFLNGPAVLYVSYLSLLWLFLSTKYRPGLKRELTIVLVLWFLAMHFAFLKGVRFSLFLTVPLGIALGGMVSELFVLGFNAKNKLLKRGVFVFVVLLCIFLSLSFVSKAQGVARSIYPLMDDEWWSVLSQIKKATPLNAVINSWWDYGDFFKTVAKRKVIFDGQSQNTPQAYWMARVLLTDNEEEAMAILRMLNNAANAAYGRIDSRLRDSLKSILLLKRLIAGDKEAEKILRSSMPVREAEDILQILRRRPPPAYFVVDPSMIRKVSSISYLGNWDFVKSYIVKQSHLGRQNLAEYLQRVAGIDRLEAERLFQEASALSGLDREEWISQRLNFYFGLFSGKKDGTLIFFDNGIVYNPEGRRAYIYSSVDYAYKVPKSIFIAKDGSLEEVVCRDANTETSILFIQNNGECKSVMLDRDLARSMFVRLYFLEGKGLRYFSPFLEQKDDGGYIRVFKINWDIPRTNNK